MRKAVEMLVIVPALILLLGGCGQSRLSRAEKLLNAGATAEALELVTQEIKDNPSEGAAYILKGRILEAKPDANGLAALDAYSEAVKADPSTEDAVVHLLLDEASRPRPNVDGGNPSNPQVNHGLYLQRAAMIRPKLLGDEDFAWQLWVKLGAEPDKFLQAFPKSSHCPPILLTKAQNLYAFDSTAAKKVFEQLATDFPQSDEGKQATKQLADWWDHRRLVLPLDHGWHFILAVQAGTRLKISISGNARVDMGGLGYVDIGPSQSLGYIGSSPQWGLFGALGRTDVSPESIWNSQSQTEAQVENQLRSWNLTGPAKEQTRQVFTELRTRYFAPGSSWQGVASHAGGLYLAVCSNAYQASLSAEVQWKAAPGGHSHR